MADFPTVLTNVVAGVTEIQAKHINNIEAKVGIDGSVVVTSLDYLLKNAASINPGHGHTLAVLTDVTALPAELNLLDLAGLTAGHVLRATGAAAAAWGAIQAGDLPTIPVDGGGTGLTTFAQGDLIYASAADTLAALAKSTTSNQFLKNSGADNGPAWASLAESDLPDLTAYAKLAGRATGQTLNGGAVASENLTLDSTAHATKGYVLLNPSGGNVGIGTATPSVALDVVGAGNFGGNITPAANDSYTIGSSSYRWSYLYGSRLNLVYSTEDYGTTGFNLSFYPTYRNSGTYYSRGQTITYYINPNEDLSANNSGYDKALHIINYVRNDCGTLTELTALQIDYGAYGLSGADLTGTINYTYGLKIAAQKVASAIIGTNYGIYLSGIAGTNTWGIYQAQNGLTGNFFASNVMIGGSNIVGTSGAKVLALSGGTPPSTSPSDAVQLWSADRGGAAGKAGLHIRSEDGTSHVLSDYVGIGTTTPSYLLDVGAGNVRITQNIGIGTATPSAYNNAGSEYFVSINRTITDATASAIKRNIDCNVNILPSAEATVYYQGISAITDIAAATAYNLNGYLRAFQAICYHRANTTLAQMYGVYVYPAIYNGGSDSTGTITSLYGVYIGSAKTASSTITTAYGLFITGITGTTAYDIYAGGAGNKNYFAGNVGIGTVNFGTSATRTLAIQNGTAPSSSPADSFQLYSADQAAGNACPHFRIENGAIIKLFQGAALTAALTTLTYTAPGTPDYAVQDLTNSGGYGFVTKDEGNTVLSVIANLQARVNGLEARLQAHGLIA